MHTDRQENNRLVLPGGNRVIGAWRCPPELVMPCRRVFGAFSLVLVLHFPRERNRACSTSALSHDSRVTTTHNCLDPTIIVPETIPPFNNLRVETDIQVDGAGNVCPSERVQPLLLYAA